MNETQLSLREGKFIVVEGTDGSGKGTQVAALAEQCRARGVTTEVIDFPRYESFWGQLIGRYLKGEFGDLKAIPPEYAAQPYMQDRAEAGPEIIRWLKDGNLVIANRYTPSNFAYMGAKVPRTQRRDFIKWMEQAEYDVNKIPREDLVLMLQVNADVGMKNVDSKGERQYMSGKGRDIHESDRGFQNEVLQTYLLLASINPHWRVIECLDNGEMLPVDVITHRLVSVLEKEGILNE